MALLPPDVATVILRARLHMLDFKVNFKKIYDLNLNCPFCSAEPEGFDHIFICPAGIYAPKLIRSIKLEMLGTISDLIINWEMPIEVRKVLGDSFVSRVVLSLSAASC